jgi:ATP-dependent DNA helicase RecG
MARKRSPQPQRSRQQSGSERSYLEYLVSTPAYRISRTELLRTIRGGEDTYLELKVRFSNVEKLTAEIIALANTDGGLMVFGVNDQLRIEGVEDPESVEEQLRELCAQQIQPPILPWINKIAFDNGRRIVVLEVTTANRPHRTLDDRFYLREGAIKRETTREELSQLFQETHLTRFEQVPVLSATVEREIDESLLWSYLRGVHPGAWGEPRKGFPTAQVMREMGLAFSFREETVVTIAGLLLFGKSERIREWVRGTEIRLTRLSGEQPSSPVVEETVLRGNLLHLFEGSLQFLERYVGLREERPSRRQRQEEEAKTPERMGGELADSDFLPVRAYYSRGAVLETLVNSLVHRDWTARERPAKIQIYDDRIEVTNPSLPLPLPIVSIRYGMTSAPNPRLKAIFTNEHYGIPPTAGGIPGLVRRATAFVRRAPEGFTLSQGEFRVVLPGLRSS